MKTNRREFLKNVSQGAVALSMLPSVVLSKEKNKISGGENNVPIKKVHMIFKRHLDVGFTASARKVTKNIWDWKIPVEIYTARSLEKEGIKPVFLYGSWAVWEALDKSKGSSLTDLEKAIDDGIVTWGGFPFYS